MEANGWHYRCHVSSRRHNSQSLGYRCLCAPLWRLWGAYFGVFDKKHVISAINVDIHHLRLDEPLSMLYTDDPVFADYLISTFEIFWGKLFRRKSE